MKTATPDHPKMHDLADWIDQATNGALGEAGIDPLNVAIGAMERLWKWCSTYALDGNVGKYSARRIADAMGWKNDPAEMVKAMVQIGWLDKTEDGKLLIHDWPDHCEDMVHAKLARKRLHFANGSIPSFSKLTVDEKREAKLWFSSAPDTAADFGGQKAPTAANGGQRAPALALAYTKTNTDFKAVGHHSNVPPCDPPTPDPQSDRPETQSGGDEEKPGACPDWCEPETWETAGRLAALIENANHPGPVVRADAGGVTRQQHAAATLQDAGRNVLRLNASGVIATVEALTDPAAKLSPELLEILGKLRRFPNGIYPQTGRGGHVKNPSMIEKAHRILTAQRAKGLEPQKTPREGKDTSEPLERQGRGGSARNRGRPDG